METEGTRIVEIVDCCAFHDWPSTHALAPYLSEGWREVFLEPNRKGGPARVRANPMYVDPMGSKRPSAFPDEGPAGSDPDLLIAQLLDEGGRDRVVLGYDDALLSTAFTNLHAARAVIRAANDWTAEEWLARDSRLYGLLMVQAAVPEEAAAEIRRVGGHERMVGVALGANALSTPFGHPVYHPIYEAACEMNLPLVLQVGSDSATTSSSPPVAGGLPSTYGEYHALAMHPLMSHVATMIIQGVFERFPQLRVMLVGGGASWLPGYLWRLNYWHKAAHQSAPWLTRLPSDYFRDHFWVTTYQLERSPSPERLAAVLGTLPWIGSRLVYASGYPNRDAAEPDEVAARLQDDWRPGVFAANSAACLRWPVEVPTYGGAT